MTIEQTANYATMQAAVAAYDASIVANGSEDPATKATVDTLLTEVQTCLDEANIGFTI